MAPSNRPMIVGALVGIALVVAVAAVGLVSARAPVEPAPSPAVTGTTRVSSPGPVDSVRPTGTQVTLAEPAGGGGPAGGSKSGEPDTGATPDDLRTHLRECEEGLDGWRAGQVDYPATLTVEAGKTVSYVAAVDIRDIPAPPGEVVPGPSPRAEPVAVKCEIAARLTPIGDGLEVDDQDWVPRTFTPNGLTRWAWAVTATKADDEDLRLELQPAITTADGGVLLGDGSTTLAVFVTRVEVTQSVGQAAGAWWDENWGKLAAIGAALGAAVLAVVRWGRGLHDAVRPRATTPARDAARVDAGAPDGTQDRPNSPSAP